MERTDHVKGALLLEVLLAGVIVAVTSLGLSAALVSGLTLEQRADRTMSRVATAENVLAQIRQTSLTDFDTVAPDFDTATYTAHSSVGASNDPARVLAVRVPLDENVIPGAIDLNGNGSVDSAVDPAEARVLLVDVVGANSLRLRTAMLDFDKVGGIVFGRDEKTKVGYGEVIEEGEPPPEPEEGEPPAPTSSKVSVLSSAFQGRSAVLVLVNESAGDLRATSVTLAPDNDSLYFQRIALDGLTVFTPPSALGPGTVTVDLAAGVPFAPGEATFSIGDFFAVTNGTMQRMAPHEMTVTIAFDDGSVAFTTVRR